MLELWEDGPGMELCIKEGQSLSCEDNVEENDNGGNTGGRDVVCSLALPLPADERSTKLGKFTSATGIRLSNEEPIPRAIWPSSIPEFGVRTEEKSVEEGVKGEDENVGSKRNDVPDEKDDSRDKAKVSCGSWLVIRRMSIGCETLFPLVSCASPNLSINMLSSISPLSEIKFEG